MVLVGVLAALVGAHLLRRRAEVGELITDIKGRVRTAKQRRERLEEMRGHRDAAVLLSFEAARAKAQLAFDDDAPTMPAPRSRHLEDIKARARAERKRKARLMPIVPPRGDA